MSVAFAMIDPRVQDADDKAAGTPPPLPPWAAGAVASEPTPGAGYIGDRGASPFESCTGWAAPGGAPQDGPEPFPAYSPRGRLIDPSATDDQKTYAMLMHLSLLLAAPAPFLSIVAPVIMWQVKKPGSRFIDDHGREAVNFHLSMLIYMLASALLMFVVIGVVLLPAVYALGIVGIVLSSIAARHGEYYRYPMCLRFLR